MRNKPKKELIPGTVYPNKYQSFLLLWETEATHYVSRKGTLRRVACQCVDCGEMSDFLLNEVSRGKSVCNSATCKPKRLLKNVKIIVGKLKSGDQFKTRRDKIFTFKERLGNDRYLIECERGHELVAYHSSIGEANIQCKVCSGKTISNYLIRLKMQENMDEIFEQMMDMQRMGTLTQYLMDKFDITEEKMNNEDLIYQS